MSITITAIIPVYNVEKYIEECLDSVLGQSVPFDEIIIINDGSTDKSGNIIEYMCNNHSEVKYIVQANQGQAVARNVGIKMATSDYIVFIDSDDYVSHDMAYILKKRLCNQEVLLYSADIIKNMDISTDGSVYVRDEEICGKQMSGWEFFKRTYGKKWTVSTCLAAYSTKFLIKNEISFPDGLFYEDNLFFIRVLNCANVLEVINNRLYIRRYRPDSTTTSVQDERKKIDLIKIYDMVFNYLKDIYNMSIAKETIIKYVCCFGMWQIKDNFDDSSKKVSMCLVQLCKTIIAFIFENQSNLSLSELLVCAYASGYLKKMNILNERDAAQYTDLLIRKITQILSPIHFSQSHEKIGIYGVGKHTKAMLYFYNKYVGDIKAEISYIVSSAVDNKNYTPLIMVDNVTNELSQIVISSRVYQEQMEQNLKSVNYNNSIIKIYDDNEFFDISEIQELL